MAGGGWDDDCDVLVAGSGGGALAGAYAAASRGLSTIVAEATDKFGGTTAYSGGGMWLPGNPVLRRSGAPDTPEAARAYYHAVVGDGSPRALQEAYLDTGPKVIEELEQNPLLQFQVYPWPDYYGKVPHAHAEGRHIIPQSLPASALGDLEDKLRQNLTTERSGLPPMAELSGGRALIGRLLLALRDTGKADLRLGCALDRLVVEDGRVVGAEVITAAGRRRIRARRGVLLATGGFERNDALRRRHGIAGPTAWTMGAPGNFGRALEAGIAIGAATHMLDEAWWSPGFLHPDGSATFTVGILGGLMVNSAGRRFANEAQPYDRLARAMLKEMKAGSDTPFWLVYDNRFADQPPIMNASVPLGAAAEYEKAGLWKTADTLEGLAAEIGVPADALKESVARFNRFAAAGVDEDFHRGEEPYEKFFVGGIQQDNLVAIENKTFDGSAEPDAGPNPNLTPVTRAPFRAAAFAVSDLGTKGGLKTDASARVLRTDGSVIPGLYAAGNTMAAVSGTAYPGGGNPNGSSVVFGYLAALDMARDA